MQKAVFGMAAALVFQAPVAAAVTQSSPTGFVSESEALIPKPPAEVWAALVNWSSWWDGAHSYSGYAANLKLEAQAGGKLIETWPGGSVLHGQVLTAIPGQLLRMDAPFGPLQALPVNAVLDYTLKAEGNGTRLKMHFRVSGQADAGLEKLAPAVDGVMSSGFARLVAFAGK